MAERIQIDHKGETYFWSEEAGVVAANDKPLPTALRRTVMTKVDKALARSGQGCANPVLLLTRASAAKKLGQLGRAEQLARRVLEIDDRDEAAVAFLSSVLRHRNKARAAVRLTATFDDSRSIILLTTRAAALLDVGDVEQARQVTDRAHVILGEDGSRPDEQLGALVERLERVEESGTETNDTHY